VNITGETTLAELAAELKKRGRTIHISGPHLTRPASVRWSASTSISTERCSGKNLIEALDRLFKKIDSAVER